LIPDYCSAKYIRTPSIENDKAGDHARADLRLSTAP
jgi:hypothetical protein